jgi:ubiquinone/menaquinone biosynthesis C-methylase UbiE
VLKEVKIMAAQKALHRMDDTERRKLQDPEAILQDIGLKPGYVFMDIGCGNGFFSIPAARIVGPGGKVYCVDVDGGSLDQIRQKAETEGLKNLTLQNAKAETVIFCEACADLIYFGTVLHDFSDPLKVLQNARKMLKAGGRLANLDWKKEEMDYGPPVAIRFDESKAEGLIKSAGFKIEDTRDYGRRHYLVIAIPD